MSKNQKVTVASIPFSTHAAAECYRNEIATIPGHQSTDIITKMDANFEETHECRSVFAFSDGHGTGLAMFMIVGVLLRHNQISMGDHPLFDTQAAVVMFSKNWFDRNYQVAVQELQNRYPDFVNTTIEAKK